MSVGDSATETGCATPADSASSAEQKGHKKALADLARDHHRALVRFLTARIGSSEEAREIAQEAYARVLALDLPDTVGFLAGYVWKTARNLATDRGRQRATRSRHLDELARGRFESHAPSPEGVTYTHQRLELLSKAVDELRRLRPRWHEAFTLRIVEERSFQEVAQRMNIAERNAMEYVAKALRHCQSYLDTAEAIRGSRNERA
jgi:RNA polymerase sigma factor (sigma-70 family)